MDQHQLQIVIDEVVSYLENRLRAFPDLHQSDYSEVLTTIFTMAIAQYNGHSTNAQARPTFEQATRQQEIAPLPDSFIKTLSPQTSEYQSQAEYWQSHGQPSGIAPLFGQEPYTL